MDSHERSARRRKMVPKAKDTAEEYFPLQTLSETPSKLPHSIDRPSNLTSLQTTQLTSPSGNINGVFRDDDGRANTGITQPLLASDDSGSDFELASRRRSEDITIVHTPDPKHPIEEDEAWWQIGIQVFIPYMIAGFGMVAAGFLLDEVQHWAVFTNVSEVFILVPALLGLKGNLEMTLASRLSTQANVGNMDKSSEMWRMIAGNLALTQAQAIVVGFLASVAAMIFGWIPQGKFNIRHGFLLCASSVMTASFASLLLGSVMIAVIVLSRKCRVNPDNVATPIAASLGDLITLALLSGISNVMYKTLDNEYWLCPLLLFLFLALTPLWCIISHRNKYVHDVLYEGWEPVIGAMIISSIGGLILDFTVDAYEGIAVFQPVINGVGGNLVAVQASCLSTSLHLRAKPGDVPEGSIEGCPNLISVYFNKGMTARTARVLLMMVLPGQLVFVYVINAGGTQHTSITPIFLCIYLIACVIQVVILLYVSVWLVHYLWKTGKDPDNFSIPYLTALGDLLGGFLLAVCFKTLDLIGDGDADVGD